MELWFRIVAARGPAMVLALLLACVSAHAAVPEWNYRIVAEFPHDPTAFTEGLAMIDGRLLESTGLEGQSYLSIREVASVAPLKRYKLDPGDFGEGTTVAGNRIVQLTWRSAIGYVYDFDLHRLGSFPLSSEGWGLTYNGHELIRSDGSSTLRFLSVDDYSETHSIEVRDGDRPIWQLNELEWAQGQIYANVWHSDRLAVIAPDDGHLIAWIDLGALSRRLPKARNWNPLDDVLNGIAYDSRSGHLYVTGKCWPKLFEIAIEPKS